MYKIRNLRLIKSIFIILIFGAITYIFTQSYKISEPVANALYEPQNQAEYEAMVPSNCLTVNEDYKKQYTDAVNKCNNNMYCLQQAKKEFAVIGNEKFITSCVQATVLNDEMSTEIIRGYAEQTQLSVYIQQAKSLTNEKLISELIKGLTDLNTKEYNVTNLDLQMNAYFREYEQRMLNNSLIEELFDSLLNKLGPCWGIPSGQCRE